jgi:hypothetical protein
MDNKIKHKINNAVKKLNQQEAYDAVSEYKFLFKYLYPTVEEKTWRIKKC